MKRRPFGRLPDGRAVEEIVLESSHAAVSVLSYGCVVRDWRVDGAAGTVPVVLGFRELGHYVEHSRSHGVIAGRVANRIARGRFRIGDEAFEVTVNAPPHHLHGGTVGLQRRVWEMDGDSEANAVHLRYASPDGEEGYPGAVDFAVTYRLAGDRLVCEMHGVPDRPTPINLAQHNYYNLAGSGDVRDHVLRIAAKDYTPVDAELIPEGSIVPVAGTRYDFTTARALAEADPAGEGYDINLVLDPARNRDGVAAEAFCPRTNLKLRLRTDQPGLQLFDAAGADVPVPGHEGARYGAFSGLCLEAQHFPDSVNRPDWPQILVFPEEPYFQRLAVRISSED
jgi:aldose 1-epimerase